MEKKNLVVGISTLAGFMQLVFGVPAPGWSTVWQNMVAQNFFGAFQSAVQGTTGLRLSGGGQTHFQVSNLAEIVNPFDMRAASATKVKFLTKTIISLIKKYTGNPISGIPIINDLISYS